MQPAADTLKILADLIGFDTTSRNSNLELIEYVRAYLNALGVAAELFPNAAGDKANLFATIGGGDPDAGIILSGHTDVVPTDGQRWNTDPFKAEIKDGKLYGRGAADMKGFLAVCLSRAPMILQAKMSAPIHLAFSYDEEVGCVGVRPMLQALRRRKFSARQCVIGEPTGMELVRAHKGIEIRRCRVRGLAAHSSYPGRGVNAVAYAAKLINFIDELAEELRLRGPFDKEFTPPNTTLHAGVIHGGTVNNIVPEACEFTFEIRHLPKHLPATVFKRIQDYAAEKLLPKMQAIDKNTGFDWELIAAHPGMETHQDSSAARTAGEWLGRESIYDLPGKVSYGSEGGLYQRAGFPSVICGPGSIEQAHGANEYVELAQLAAAEKFLDTLIASLHPEAMR